MDLLKMNVAPQAILQVLRSISGQRPKKISSPEVSQRPNPGDERRGKPRSRVPSNKKPEARRWPQAHSDNKSTEQTYSNTRQCREQVYITLLRRITLLVWKIHHNIWQCASVSEWLTGRFIYIIYSSFISFMLF